MVAHEDQCETPVGVGSSILGIKFGRFLIFFYGCAKLLVLKEQHALKVERTNCALDVSALGENKRE